MELFTLLTKLTLDTSEYESALNEAEKQGGQLENIESSLGLDDSEFYAGIEEAENTDVDDPESPDLDLNVDGYESSLTEAEGSTKDFELSVGKIFDNIGGMVTKAGIALGISALVKDLGEGVELARKLGDDIDKSSQRLNISTDAYQEWSHALSQSGASVSDITRGIMNMTQFLSGGASDEISGAFETLKISATDANGQVKTTEQLLSETMLALANFKGSAEDRGALAMAIFGRNGQQLNALFNSGSQGIKDLIQEAHDLGLVMSPEEIANSVAFGDAVDNMHSSIEALKTSMVTDLLPVLTDVANTVARVVAFFNPRTQQKSLSDIYADKDNAFAEELVTIEGTSAAAETLADKLLAMGDTSKMTAEQYEIWKNTANELISLVPSLGDVIDVESGQIKANSDEIKENIKQWENLAKQKALQTLKEEKYQAIVDKNKELIDATSKAMTTAAEKERARVEAYHAFSDEMEKRGLGTLDFEAGNLDEQISAVMDSLAEMGESGESDALALGTALKKLGEAGTEAGKAQAEGERLTKELEKGKEEYQTWLENVESMYGGTSEEAQGAISDVENLDNAIKKLPKQKQIQIDILTFTNNGFLPTVQKAKGDWNVPYDMPVFVHRDETILSASQARRYREGEGTGDIRGIRNEIAMGIRDGMTDASVNAYMDGRKVSKKIGSYNSRETASKQRGMGG